MKESIIRFIIEEGYESGMSWKCLPCKSTAPTLHNINSALHHMCIQADKRMDHMETRVTHLETNTKQIVKEEVVN